MVVLPKPAGVGLLYVPTVIGAALGEPVALGRPGQAVAPALGELSRPVGGGRPRVPCPVAC
ncbi:hypothetical protein ACIA98_16610 [Streptomyces sp. NPDC051366]|uniref:hypothetical protein n=1 Tax=Streptomyces sp. NPDC051366 TaxID=3365652 RepID=UPI0037B0012A